ncbi:MAG TPA: SpoIIE family protein phosphatase [Candidatus Polarisedimenticolia bacterium]|nr:SpoIIE family protein phosphatase [Candidatus Polarisedimenticolia bacterium]
MDFVVVKTADGKTFRRELNLPKIVIGRSSRSDLVVPDLSLSRVHAELYRDGENYLIKDAGSKNGTFLNDRPVISPTLLRKGDKIGLGTAAVWFNSEPQSRVEITDNPTPVAGTTVVPVEQLLSDPSTLGSTTSPGDRSASRPLEILQKAGDQLIALAPLDELLGSIMDLMFEAVRPERGFLMLLNPTTGALEPKVIRDEKRSAGGEIALSRHIADMVVHGKQSVLTSDAMHDPRFEQGESIMAQGIRSAMCVPLWNSREVMGLVYVDSRIRSNSFTAADLRILSNLANVAAVKIENNRLFERTLQVRALERDLELAAAIQRNLMPRACPPVKGFDIAGTNLPCRTVGGDTFDFLPRAGSLLWVAIGDVAGKGLPAAMIMSHFQAMLRGLAEADRPLSQLVGRLNDNLSRTLSVNQFISFCVVELEPEEGILRYVNAGHNPPFMVRASGEVDRFHGSGPVLGVVPGVPYPAHETRMDVGDTLLLYSDGATESQNPAEEEFGEDRLISCLKQVTLTGSEAGLAKLEGSILGFCGLAPRYDDITLLLMRRIGP